MRPSLCESCENMREVRTARSRFLLCELALANPNCPKYPPQPVVECDGHQLSSEINPDRADNRSGEDN